MDIERIKQMFWPFVGGVIVGAMVLSFGFGFMSKGNAAKLIGEAELKATVAALSPLCAAAAQAEPERLAEIMSRSLTQQRTAVAEAGWVVYPTNANAALKRALDQGCVDAVK